MLVQHFTARTVPSVHPSGSSIYALKAFPDSSQVVVAADTCIKVFKILDVLQGRTNSVSIEAQEEFTAVSAECVIQQPDETVGYLLLAGFKDGTASLYLASQQGAPFTKLWTVSHTSGTKITATAISRDGRYFATADAEGRACVWNKDGASPAAFTMTVNAGMQNPRPLCSFPQHAHAPHLD